LAESNKEQEEEEGKNSSLVNLSTYGGAEGEEARAGGGGEFYLTQCI